MTSAESPEPTPEGRPAAKPGGKRKRGCIWVIEMLLWALLGGVVGGGMGLWYVISQPAEHELTSFDLALPPGAALFGLVAALLIARLIYKGSDDVDEDSLSAGCLAFVIGLISG